MMINNSNNGNGSSMQIPQQSQQPLQQQQQQHVFRDGDTNQFNANGTVGDFSQRQQQQQQQQQPAMMMQYHNNNTDSGNSNNMSSNDDYGRNFEQQQQQLGGGGLNTTNAAEASTSSSASSLNNAPLGMPPRASIFVTRQSDVRSRYVDVFNPTGVSESGDGISTLSGSAADIAAFLPPPIAVVKPQKFFVPGPSAADEGNESKRDKIESESPHYVDNQQVLSPMKRDDSPSNNSNRHSQHLNQFQQGSPSVPEEDEMLPQEQQNYQQQQQQHFNEDQQHQYQSDQKEYQQDGIVNSEQQQQQLYDDEPPQHQQMYDQWGNLIEQQLQQQMHQQQQQQHVSSQPPSARSIGEHESTSQFDAYANDQYQQQQYPPTFDQQHHQEQYQQYEYEHEHEKEQQYEHEPPNTMYDQYDAQQDNFPAPPPQPPQTTTGHDHPQQNLFVEEETNNNTILAADEIEYDGDDDYLRPPQIEAPKNYNDGYDFAPRSPRIGEDGTQSVGAFSGNDYDYGNVEMPPNPVPKDDATNDDDETEDDDGDDGQDAPPFNPDDYPGWVLDEASGAWYFAGDGAEEEFLVEEGAAVVYEEGVEEYEYDTTGWIEREVYDDIAAKLANAEVAISDKNVEIDAAKNENENLKLKNADIASELEQAERELAELKLKVDQLQSEHDLSELIKEAEAKGYQQGYDEATKYFEEEMNDLLMCLGQSERACDKLKEKLAEAGADVDAILEELEAEEDEELNRLFAQATTVNEEIINGGDDAFMVEKEADKREEEEEQTTPIQSPQKKSNYVLGDLDFPDAPDSPYIDENTSSAIDESNAEADEEEEDGGIPLAPAGVAPADISAFFHDFHLPTPPRGQGVYNNNNNNENNTQSANYNGYNNNAPPQQPNFEDANDDIDRREEEEGDFTEVPL